MVGWHRGEPDPPFEFEIPFHADGRESMHKVGIDKGVEVYFNVRFILVVDQVADVIFYLIDVNDAGFYFAGSAAGRAFLGICTFISGLTR
jgi:hypothetical protein